MVGNCSLKPDTSLLSDTDPRIFSLTELLVVTMAFISVRLGEWTGTAK